MKLGANLDERAAKAIGDQIRELLLPDESVELIVQGSHNQNPGGDHIIVTNQRVVSISLKRPTTPALVLTLSNCERVYEVKVLETRVLCWDGSTIDLGMLRRRREDEQSFVEAVTAIMQRSPDYEARKRDLGERVVKIVGHKYADDGGEVAKRRLHDFLASDETVEFMGRIKAAREFEADSLALTSSRVLLFGSNAFGEEPVFAMPYEWISGISTEKGEVIMFAVDGSSTSLGKLRHDKHDLVHIDSILSRFGPQVTMEAAPPAADTREVSVHDLASDPTQAPDAAFEALLGRGQPLVGHRFNLDDLRHTQSFLEAGLEDDESLVLVLVIRSTKPFADTLLFTSHRAMRLRVGSRDPLEEGVRWSQRPILRVVDGDIRVEDPNGSEDRFATLRHPKQDTPLLLSAIRALRILSEDGRLSVDGIDLSATTLERPVASLGDVELMEAAIDSGSTLAALREIQWPISEDEAAERLWISLSRVTLLTSHQLIGWKSPPPSDGNRIYRRNLHDVEVVAQITLEGSGVSWLVVSQQSDSIDIHLLTIGKDSRLASGMGLATVTRLTGADPVGTAIAFQTHLVYVDRERFCVWSIRKDLACELSISTESITGMFLTRDGIVLRSTDAFVHEIPVRSSRDSELFPELERAWRLLQAQISGLAQPEDVPLGENILSFFDRDISIWSIGKNPELRGRFSVDDLNAVLLDGDTLVISANGRPALELKNLGTQSESIFSNFLDTLSDFREDLVKADAATDWLSGLAAFAAEHFGAASVRVYELMCAALPSSPFPYGSERLPLIAGEFERDGRGVVAILATDARMAFLPVKKWRPRGEPRIFSHAEITQMSVEIDVIENIASSGKVRERHRLLVNVSTAPGELIPLTYELGNSLAERNSSIQAPFSGLRSLTEYGWPVVFEGESTRRFYAQSSTPRMGFGIGMVSFD